MSPALTFVLNLIGSKISYFSILKTLFVQVQRYQMFQLCFETFFCSTTFTIIPGGGLLLNFFFKMITNHCSSNDYCSNDKKE
jgi:hypothetical protein